MLFTQPSSIVYGPDCIETITDYVPGQRILIITGQFSAAKTGLEKRIVGLFEVAGKETRVFSGISAEPRVYELQDARNCLRDFKADAVISAGGGSVIDVGKAAAGLAHEEGDAAEYFKGRSIDNPGIFFGAVPTTAGTGSEATPNSVLSDPEAVIKKSIRAPHMMPGLAMLDPSLTASCPPKVTAYAGMDALVQAIEALFSRHANAYTDGLAQAALGRMYPALPGAFRDPQQIKPRADMLYGAFYTGMAFANCRLGAVHGLAHPVGLLTHTGHGLVCARLIGPVLKRNRDISPEKYEILKTLWGTDPLEALAGLLVQLDIKPLFNARLDKNQMGHLLAYTASAGSMKANPGIFNPEEQIAILRDAGIETD